MSQLRILGSLLHNGGSLRVTAAYTGLVAIARVGHYVSQLRILGSLLHKGGILGSLLHKGGILGSLLHKGGILGSLLYTRVAYWARCYTRVGGSLRVTAAYTGLVATQGWVTACHSWYTGLVAIATVGHCVSQLRTWTLCT